MMKRSVSAFAVLLLICLIGTHVQATPVDLSTFTSDPGVTVSSGVVNFTEDPLLTAVYLYDDHYLVGSNVTALSFDYSFSLGANDPGDSFVFELDYLGQVSVLLQVAVVTTTDGHVPIIDLSAYQGKQVSLAWGLIYGGGFDTLGSTATINNIQLATSASQVPEPSTLLLLGSGLAGMVGFSRKRKSQRS